MKNRVTASFGKRSEFLVMAELLRRSFDVYPTLVDDQAIDCIIRLDEGRYVDIQIKSRNQDGIHWNKFGPLIFVPRPNYIFIFYTEINNTYWVIPTHELVELCREGNSGKHEGKMSLHLPRADEGEKADRYERYRNNFSLIWDLANTQKQLHN